MLLPMQGLAAGPWSGSFSTQWRGYSHAGDGAGDTDYTSVAVEPDYSTQWLDRRLLFTFEGFARGGSRDSGSNHADLRVFSLNYAADAWELRAGMRKVFWGVTESQHLVDIVNQTDLVEGMDGEEKLGQPMLDLALIGEWGTLDMYVLPYFRPRTYPAADGRPFLGLPVDTDHPLYESADGDRHVDYAARWYKSIAAWDLGLSYFAGTAREPRLLPQVDATGASLRPYYYQMRQSALDAQATYGSWLWKLEAVYRQTDEPAYGAATAGLEYTFADIAGSGVDLGVVLEYLYDERGSQSAAMFADDTMLGLRLALNDTAGSEALLGVIYDNGGDGHTLSLEASRRVGDHWKISLQGLAFASSAADAPLYALRDEDQLQLDLAYHW